MCKRHTADPLVQLLVERYHVNLLPIPRANAHCGDLYVKPRGSATAVPGQLAQFLEEPVELPPVTVAEQLADVASSTSSQVEATVGLRLLEGFLTATGLAPGVAAKVKGGYKRRGAHTVGFSLGEVTRDAIDAPSLALALVGHQLAAGHPWVARGTRYYVAAGVLRARSLTLRAEDARANAVELDGELPLIAGANAGASAQRTADGAIVYSGPTPLAVGVELYELRYDGDLRCTDVGVLDEAVALHRLHPLPPEPAFPAGEEEVLLPLVA